MEIDKENDEETEVINLKDNFLPKGLIPLEDLFDSNDIPKKSKMEPVITQETHLGCISVMFGNITN